jgi:hypothetical protein
MGKKAFLLSVLLTVVAPAPIRAATITWACRSTAPARDACGELLQGASTFGTPNLSRGALVQFWLAVGAIDDPFMVQEAYMDTAWKIDDVLLQESHIGHGTFLSNAGTWSTRSDFAVNEGDILYVRAYNLPKADWLAGQMALRDLGIRNSADEIVFQTLDPVMSPQTLYFDDLRAGRVCVPEPSALLLILPALAVWKIRRRKGMR